MTRATDPQRVMLDCKCLHVLLLAILVLWQNKPCMLAVFDQPVGGSAMVCKNMLATSRKLGENVSHPTVLHVVRFNTFTKFN